MTHIQDYVIILDYWLKLFLSSLIFLPYFEKRKGFRWTLPLVLAGGLILTGIVSLNPPDGHIFMQTATVYLLFTLIVNAFLVVCLRADVMTYIFYWCYIVFLTGPIDMCRKAFEMLGWIQPDGLSYWLVTLLLMAIVYTGGYFFINKASQPLQGRSHPKVLAFLVPCKFLHHRYHLLHCLHANPDKPPVFRIAVFLCSDVSRVLACCPVYVYHEAIRRGAGST